MQISVVYHYTKSQLNWLVHVQMHATVQTLETVFISHDPKNLIQQ